MPTCCEVFEMQANGKRVITMFTEKEELSKI